MLALRPSSARVARPPRLRVLVVDDSPFMQRRMGELLESDGDLEMVAVAHDGHDAIRRAAEVRPDVITMDIHMPRMDGLLAIEHIMRTRPRPIVVVSSFVRSGSAAAIAALAHGAVDLVQKPSADGISLDLALVADDLRRKVRTAARVRVVRSLCPIGPAVSRCAPRNAPATPWPVGGLAAGDQVVLVGCSTGGPAALLQLARQWRGRALPAMVVAQHLPAEFTAELALQMSSHLDAPVREAVPGDRPQGGVILVAPGGHHLTINARGVVEVVAAGKAEHCVPSIDRLFESAAAALGSRALGVVLTGMGHDGAAGAGAIRRAGGAVWTQDEASSIIDGMPRAVREAGHASRVLSLEEIGRALAAVPAPLFSP